MHYDRGSPRVFLSPTDRLDLAAKDLEAEGKFGEAAGKRYDAAQLYEKEGAGSVAMRSYNRAATDSNEELNCIERSMGNGDLKERRKRELQELNYRSNLNAGRLYYANGMQVEAAFSWCYAARRAAELGDRIGARCLVAMADDLFIENKAEILPPIIHRIFREILGASNEPTTGTHSQNQGIGAQA
jgi:hypothetical protein